MYPLSIELCGSGAFGDCRVKRRTAQRSVSPARARSPARPFDVHACTIVSRQADLHLGRGVSQEHFTHVWEKSAAPERRTGSRSA
jgi:hypothetical protein